VEEPPVEEEPPLELLLPPVAGEPAWPPGASSLLLQAGSNAASAALNTQTVVKLCKFLKTKSFSKAFTAW